METTVWGLEAERKERDGGLEMLCLTRPSWGLALWLKFRLSISERVPPARMAIFVGFAMPSPPPLGAVVL